MKKYVRSSIKDIEMLAMMSDPVYEDDLVDSIKIGIANMISESGMSFEEAVDQAKTYYTSWVDEVASSMKKALNL